MEEEFIKKLAMETPLSYQDSKFIVQYIQDKAKGIDKAKVIYEKDGYLGLTFYVRLLSAII